MKFGVNAWVWTAGLTTKDVEELAPHVAKLGFDWLEIPLEDLNAIDFTRAGEVLKANGLSASGCGAFGPDRDLISPDAGIRRNAVAYVKGCVDAVAAMGGQNVVGPLYSAVGRTWKQTPEDRAKDMDILVAELKELAAYAGDRGVYLCLEPLNRFETSFVNLASQGMEIIGRVDHPNCQMMLDTFHMNIEEKSLGDAIRLVGKNLKHVHTCENDRGAPGSGNVTWNEVARALKDISYNGPVVIESFTSKVESIARAAAIWRPLAESQDALASDGLAFLKGLLV
jgi:D-psicose/D-tagatose/L-ribulose 3-epimerase